MAKIVVGFNDYLFGLVEVNGLLWLTGGRDGKVDVIITLGRVVWNLFDLLEW